MSEPSTEPPKTPAEKRTDPASVGCGLVILLVLLAIIITAVVQSGNSNPANAQATTAAAPPITAPRPHPTTAPVPTATSVVPVTLLHDTGTGDTLTSDFGANDYWELTWKCDRTSDYGLSYNVIIELIDSSTGTNKGTLVNALCENGQTGGTVYPVTRFLHLALTGDYSLQIISEGWWDVTIQTTA